MTLKACAYPRCPNYSHNGKPLCAKHQRAADRPANRKANRRRGNNPMARQLRSELNQVMSWPCAHCHLHRQPNMLEVDHIQPLHLGGVDTSGNLQVLCRPCHATKTRNEQL